MVDVFLFLACFVYWFAAFGLAFVAVLLFFTVADLLGSLFGWGWSA